jgi:hypothetical protein
MTGAKCSVVDVEKCVPRGFRGQMFSSCFEARAVTVTARWQKSSTISIFGTYCKTVGRTTFVLLRAPNIVFSFRTVFVCLISLLVPRAGKRCCPSTYCFYRVSVRSGEKKNIYNNKPIPREVGEIYITEGVEQLRYRGIKKKKIINNLNTKHTDFARWNGFETARATIATAMWMWNGIWKKYVQKAPPSSASDARKLPRKTFGVIIYRRESRW